MLCRLVVVATLVVAPCLAADLVGTARVVDGDTLDVEAAGVRLHAMDAPEAAQDCRDDAGRRYACGAEAAGALRDLVEGHELRCEPRYADRYGRTVATCFLGGVDAGRRKVQLGEAVAFRKYGLDYVADADQARAARRGLWRGEFTMPADWRAGAR
jgi:endonuclease YncB( thermonuclease family)